MLTMWRCFVDAADWFCLRGRGYQFWSGLGSGSPIIAAIYFGYRKHTCHIQGCWRLSWHPDPGHGHPLCRRHHPHSDAEILTTERTEIP